MLSSVFANVDLTLLDSGVHRIRRSSHQHLSDSILEQRRLYSSNAMHTSSTSVHGSFHVHAIRASHSPHRRR